MFKEDNIIYVFGKKYREINKNDEFIHYYRVRVIINDINLYSDILANVNVYYNYKRIAYDLLKSNGYNIGTYQDFISVAIFEEKTINDREKFFNY